MVISGGCKADIHPKCKRKIICTIIFSSEYAYNLSSTLNSITLPFLTNC